MAERRKVGTRRVLAAQFGIMTPMIFLVLVGTVACSVAETGPDVALDRVGCGPNDVVDGLLAHPRPCH